MCSPYIFAQSAVLSFVLRTEKKLKQNKKKEENSLPSQSYKPMEKVRV